MDGEDDAKLHTLNMVTYGILFPVLLVVGSVGSLVNIIVLYSMRHKSPSCYMYMRGISICDLMFLVITVPFTVRLSNNVNSWQSKWVAWYYAHGELYLTNLLAGAGTFMMVAITFERYIAFCHPFLARSWKLARARHYSHIVAFILPLVAAVLYLPYALQYSIVQNEENRQATNGTAEVVYCLIDNDLVIHNEFYKVYDIGKEVIFRINPTVFLIYMNIHIIVAYNRASVHLKRSLFAHRQVPTCGEVSLAEDRRLVFILAALSIKFLLCTIPAAALSLTIGGGDTCGSFYFCIFRAIANTLELVKSSSTFFIFYVCCANFRQELQQLIT